MPMSQETKVGIKAGCISLLLFVALACFGASDDKARWGISFFFTFTAIFVFGIFVSAIVVFLAREFSQINRDPYGGM